MRRRRAFTLACALALVLALLALPTPLLASSTPSRFSQPVEPVQEVFYVVESGDTLFSIARRYGTTVSAIADANRLEDPARIYVGQRLMVPLGDFQGIEPPHTLPYQVQFAEGLADIALRHGTTWRALSQLNDMVSPDVLYAGKTIQVPATEGGRVEAALHFTQPHDTLLGVALRHDVPPMRLSMANRSGSLALMYPGQRVLIPGETERIVQPPLLSARVDPAPALQGETLVISVRATHLVTVTGELFESPIRFFEEDGVHYGLVGIHAFTDPGLHELHITATQNGGSSTNIGGRLLVQEGQFGYERIQAPPGLLDPAVSAAENDLLDRLRPTFTEPRKWSGTLQRPGDGTISSHFGTRRAYNDGPYAGYHGGVDLRGSTGTPVYAPAAGTVVLTEDLIIRGGALMLDHGWGMLTGYWHLSEIEVELGQHVQQGDLIARIGNTGLSTGAHLHWEMWIGGVNVNPMQWLEPFHPWPEGW